MSVDTETSGYPPADHFVRDLGVVSHRVSQARTLSAAALDDAAFDRAGLPALGFSSAFVDINAAQASLVAVQPRWTATSGMALHLSGAGASGAVVGDSHVARVGSNLVVIRTAVYDAAGRDPDAALDVALDTASAGAADLRESFRPIGSGLLTFARIPAEASVVSGHFDADAPPARTRMLRQLPPRAGGFPERLGTVVQAPGVVMLEPSPYVSNSFGTITGGVYGVLFQLAGESWAPELVATDLQIQFLSQTRVGPVVTTATVVRESPGALVCDVESRVGDKLLTVGSVTLSTPSPR